MESDRSDNPDEQEILSSVNPPSEPEQSLTEGHNLSLAANSQESRSDDVSGNAVQAGPSDLRPVSISASPSLQHTINSPLDAIPEQGPAFEPQGSVNPYTGDVTYFDQAKRPESVPFDQSTQYNADQVNNSDQDPIYSIVNKLPLYFLRSPSSTYENLPSPGSLYNQNLDTNQVQSPILEHSDANQTISYPAVNDDFSVDKLQDPSNIDDLDLNMDRIFLSRHKQGAVESGSFRNNFKKKIPSSASSTDNDLSTHRQKLIESRDVGQATTDEGSFNGTMLKRNQSVSFNMQSSRGSRVSVDIRNLPSYLTGKRASIVDVARGAMSALFHIGSSASSHRHSSASSRSPSPGSESSDEPIFEEPIAPTLSLGQRVAWVSADGPEFGTVGWIGQLPDIDDDWIVGVIFDNMIGNCDGEYQGVRYFYARENFAMFLPLSALTKTDNYIGRPETGTMLSRMSVSLKPGQLISIQRSSIRLQHCFLNAPHQRVGHDVRAVSNRLHCQCHTCGPCAHLTKQGQRLTVLPHFGARHTHHERKKNSLAQAAIELFAHHHHHHFHEEDEPHEHEDHRFGDNSAHACNFVRYSCCQQNGVGTHDFLADCEMVRPELLDNLIHAPRAPHSRSRLRGTKRSKQPSKKLKRATIEPEKTRPAEKQEADQNYVPDGTIKSWQTDITTATEGTTEQTQDHSEASSSYSSCSSRSSSKNRDNQSNEQGRDTLAYGSDLTNYRQDNNIYHAIDSHISIMDQRRFIQQRDSSAMIQSNVSFPSDDSLTARRGLGSAIRRCFFCLIGKRRPDSNSKRRKRHRKLSARNRLIEYRRKQSTFVPSTLAKPQDDFASHGLEYPGYDEVVEFSIAHNLEPDLGDAYDSRSSDSQSPDGSRNNRNQDAGFNKLGNLSENIVSNFTGIEQGKGQDRPSYELMKSLPTDGSLKSLYSDSGKKSFTYSIGEPDFGYFDTYTSSSNDTLKHIIDQSINEQEASPRLEYSNEYTSDSPVVSSFNGDESQCRDVEISSLTASVQDPLTTVDCEDQVSEMIRQLDLDEDQNKANESTSRTD